MANGRNRPLPVNLMNDVHFTGADVIVRKAQQFIVRRLPGDDTTSGNLARHEWQRLAHDDIGAC